MPSPLFPSLSPRLSPRPAGVRAPQPARPPAPAALRPPSASQRSRPAPCLQAQIWGHLTPLVVSGGTGAAEEEAGGGGRGGMTAVPEPPSGPGLDLHAGLELARVLRGAAGRRAQAHWRRAARAKSALAGKAVRREAEEALAARRAISGLVHTALARAVEGGSGDGAAGEGLQAALATSLATSLADEVPRGRGGAGLRVAPGAAGGARSRQARRPTLASKAWTTDVGNKGGVNGGGSYSGDLHPPPPPAAAAESSRRPFPPAQIAPSPRALPARWP